MKILYVFPRNPFPESDGGAQAMADTVKLFHEMGHDLTFVGFQSELHKQSREELQKYGSDCTVAGQFKDYTRIEAFFNLFSKLPLQIAERMRDALFQESLNKVRDSDFDVAFIDMVHAGKFIPLLKARYPKCKIIVRTHNAEFEIITDLTVNRNYLERFFLHSQSRKLKNFEESVLSKADGVVFLSDEDRLKFKETKLSTIIPPSVSFAAPKVHSEPIPYRFFMFGSWKWQPNEDGLLWFLDNVWVFFSREHPSAQLYVAGGGLHVPLDEYNNVEYLGFLSDEDLNTQIEKSTAVIAPLFSGSGIKMKVLRAMSMGAVVIGNKKAFQGISSEHKNAVVATPIDFLSVMQELSVDMSKNKSIRTDNLEFVSLHFSKKAISKKYLDLFNGIVSKEN